MQFSPYIGSQGFPQWKYSRYSGGHYMPDIGHTVTSNIPRPGCKLKHDKYISMFDKSIDRQILVAERICECKVKNENLLMGYMTSFGSKDIIHLERKGYLLSFV